MGFVYFGDHRAPSVSSPDIRPLEDWDLGIAIAGTEIVPRRPATGLRNGVALWELKTGVGSFRKFPEVSNSGNFR